MAIAMAQLNIYVNIGNLVYPFIHVHERLRTAWKLVVWRQPCCSDGHADGAAVVDVLGCLPDNVRLHLYGLPWTTAAPSRGCHSDAEGAIVRLAATWKVGFP